MRVADIISRTIWMPGGAYDAAYKPAISVLLPTFRRGRSGLFRKAVDSLLRQTLRDLEIIIIDDASVDGTADQIEQFQRMDGRVHCLRHPENVGLPAVSEFEAYQRARADMLVFAFDDCVFEEDALERLLAAFDPAEPGLIVGRVKLFVRPGDESSAVALPPMPTFSNSALSHTNCIANSGVLMSKAIVETVGLYDPSVVMTRICDWDLWRRVADVFPITFVDVDVGREYGLVTNDSLGATYSMDSWAVAEWMATDRNALLLPANFADYQVFAPNPLTTRETAHVCDSYAARHIKTRPWMGFSPTQTPLDGKILIIAPRDDASLALCFDFLPIDVRRLIRVITVPGPFGVEQLHRAACIILIRHFHRFGRFVDRAADLGIPVYYYLDDHLPMMFEEDELSSEAAILEPDFADEHFREHISKCAGVLLTTRRLCDAFAKEQYHENLIHFPIAAHDLAPLPRVAKRRGAVTFAAFVGAHRLAAFKRTVLPALERLAIEGAYDVIVLLPKFQGRKDLDITSNRVSVEWLDYEQNYRSALQRFAQRSPDFLLVPPADTVNQRFKTLHPVLSACLLDAVPVLPMDEPYSDLSQQGSAVLVQDHGSPEGWYSALSCLVASPDRRADIVRLNRRYCETHFSGRENRDVLLSLIDECGGAVDWPEQLRRAQLLTLPVPAERAAKAVESVESVEAASATSRSLAMQLAEHRRALNSSRRMRVLRQFGDLWEAVGPAYEQLKRDSERRGLRARGARLSLGDSLHFDPYREYSVAFDPGRISSLDFALSLEYAEASGAVGVELVDEAGVIRAHVRRPLALIDFGRPVRFEFDDVVSERRQLWRVRLFVVPAVPVYAFEFHRDRWLGLAAPKVLPFMSAITG